MSYDYSAFAWLCLFLILKVELRSEPDGQGANVKALLKILEELEWRHAAESSIYLDFLNEATLSHLRTQPDESLKSMTDNPEETKWEHAVESSICLEILNETALSNSQESRYLKEKLREEVSILLSPM